MDRPRVTGTDDLGRSEDLRSDSPAPANGPDPVPGALETPAPAVQPGVDPESAAGASPAENLRAGTEPGEPGAGPAGASGQIPPSNGSSHIGTDKPSEFVPSKYLSLFYLDLEELIRTHREASITDAKLAAKRANQLGRLIVLARRMQSDGASAGTYHAAYLAAQALRSPLFWSDTTEKVIADLEFRTSSSPPIYLVLRGLLMSLGILLILTVLGFVFFAATYAVDFGWTWSAVLYVEGMLKEPIIISMVFGVLGSLVSVLLRLSEFEGSTRSRQLLITTGAVLPIVGVIFAAVAAAMFSSGMINFSFGTAELPTENPKFYIVLGFLAGFSERFMRGLLGRIEDRVAVQADREIVETPDARVTTEQVKSITQKK